MRAFLKAHWKWGPVGVGLSTGLPLALVDPTQTWGIVLMATGISVSVLMVVPALALATGRRISRSIVRSAFQTEGVAWPPVAGADRNGSGDAAAGRRELRIAAQTIRTELFSCARTVEHALANGRHWDPAYTGLPSNAWVEHSATLAAEPVFADAYDACREAYVEANQLNIDNGQHWERGRRNMYDPTPADYGDAAARLAIAEQELASALGAL